VDAPAAHNDDVSSPLSHALRVVTTIPDELATSPPSSDTTLTL
jgi:hypothetical protein